MRDFERADLEKILNDSLSASFTSIARGEGVDLETARDTREFRQKQFALIFATIAAWALLMGGLTLHVFSSESVKPVGTDQLR
jgi:hypothetical protein